MATKKKHTRGPIDVQLTALAEAKLASSGLDLKAAVQLGIVPLTATQVQALGPSPPFFPLRALRLNYYAPDGSPLADHHACPPFFRLRFLELPNDPSIATKKPVRYVQPPRTLPVAYYPRTQDWELLADPGQPLLLTEGELKAAAACVAGYPCIGLGGVRSWQARGSGYPWLPSLDLVTWPRRHVYIVFDSDLRTNPQVCHALHELAQQLERRGAHPHLVLLPSLPGLEKVGLDDYLVREGAAHLAELLHLAEPLGLAAPLWGLNQRFVYVRQPGLVITTDAAQKVSPAAFRDHLASTTEYHERELRPDGTVRYKPTSAAASWLRWPLRREVRALTYAPGEPRDTAGCFNTWPGWGAEPRRGDVKPFLDLLTHLFTGAEVEAQRWFLQWAAYPLQHPGAKLFSAVVFHGVRHGTGKSQVGYTLGRIYGENFGKVVQSDLHASFNEWVEGKQFILGDDVSGSSKRQDADLLKTLITQQEVRVNAKYVPTYVVPDRVNYYFTSNHPDAVFLEDDDRRFFVHEVTTQPLPEDFYRRYAAWRDADGPAALFHYLLALDLGDFNPAAPAYRTRAKERLIHNTLSDLGSWVRQLLADPDHALKVGNIALTQDLFTARELLALYEGQSGRTGTTAGGVGRELARCGVRQVCDGRPVRAVDGSQARYYAVRGSWGAATPAEVVKHLRDCAERKKK